MNVKVNEKLDSNMISSVFTIFSTLNPNFILKYFLSISKLIFILVIVKVNEKLDLNIMSSVCHNNLFHKPKFYYNILKKQYLIFKLVNVKVNEKVDSNMKSSVCHDILHFKH